MTKQDLYRTVKNLCTRTQNRGATFFRYNAKTLVSLDKDTVCPKAACGNACRYCYRHDLQKAKRLTDRTYYEGDLRADVIVALNYGLTGLREILEEYGMQPHEFSIRTFSLSDYKHEDRPFWRKVWSIVRAHGFKVHVITKQLDHAEWIASRVDHVQLSVDALDHPHRIKARQIFIGSGNISIRCVELSEADAWLREISDIVTVYHGNRVKGLETYRTNAASHKKLCARIQKQTTAAVCCVTGTCIDCRKCWL